MDKKKKTPNTVKKTRAQKLPAAVELGHLGGLEGGPARARKLADHVRRRIAHDAAEARWHGRKKV